MRHTIPQATAFDDLFRGGASVWAKIGGAAIATPLTLFVITRRMAKRGEEVHFDSGTQIVILLLSVVVGAFIGASLSMKDIVERRKARKKRVPFFLDLLYGKGIISLLVFWAPFAIICTIATTILTL